MGPALEVMRLWPQIAGPMIASHLAPVSFRDRCLYLLADQAVWGHQLSFLEPELLARFEQAMGPGIVASLRLSTHAPLAAPGGPPLPQSEPRLARPVLAELSDHEEAAIARQAASFISRSDLAERFAAVERVVKRVQLGRKLAGGRSCTVCGVFHLGRGPRCELCKFERS